MMIFTHIAVVELCELVDDVQVGLGIELRVCKAQRDGNIVRVDSLYLTLSQLSPFAADPPFLE